MNHIAKRNIRVMVADAHFAIRMGLKISIANEPGFTVAGEAGTGKHAIDVWHRQQPDVAVMDWDFPDLTGLAVVKAIRLESPNAGIVMLSTLDGTEAVYRALETGVLAYLLKSAQRDELLQAVRSAASGQRYFSGSLAATLAKSPPVKLRAHELELLQLVSKGRSHQEIAAALGLAEDDVQANAVQIMEKFKANTLTQAVTSALQRGFFQLE
jgi:DNA-binding NarL/FixJ family response regulator